MNPSHYESNTLHSTHLSNSLAQIDVEPLEHFESTHAHLHSKADNNRDALFKFSNDAVLIRNP